MINKIVSGRLDSHLDKKIDVYAYGMTLLHVIIGSKPWAGLESEIEDLVLQGKRPDLPKESSEIVAMLLEIVKKCWDQSPIMRPSFAQIKSQLEQSIQQSTSGTHH